MYATLSRLHPKAGQEQVVLDQLFRWEQEHLPRVSGFVGGYVFEPVSGSEAASHGILLLTVFDSQTSSTRHRQDPAQDRWEQHLRLLLAQEPEWYEGEITELSAELRGL
jgi:heme-degrading monooxygenase HmoA